MKRKQQRTHCEARIGAAARRALADNARSRTLADRVEQWFESEARDLPWRRSRSAYTALVAEFMLQQTQVSRVTEAFCSFLGRFPGIQELAAARDDEVMAAWQGLGYYRRARLLHAAARAIASDHGGDVPAEATALQTLPGVGRYTAGAISSIVFGKREAIVDGNVARVLARLFALEDRSGDTSAWRIAERLVAASRRPGVFNEGLMELGAILCTPSAPRCSDCPLRSLCMARRAGSQERIPLPRPRTRQQSMHHYAVIIARPDGRVLLQRRPEKGLWAGMWEVPTIESPHPIGHDELRTRLPVQTGALSHAGSFRYQTTHRRILFIVHRGDCLAAPRKAVWRHPDNLGELPISNAQRKVLREHA